MAPYRLTVRLTAPLGTPVQGPTLFGLICWLIRDAEGEAALTAWLADPARCWTVSDGFPAGWLPRPLVHPAPVAEADFDRLKEAKKRTFVRRAAWLRLRDGWRDAGLAEGDTASDPALIRRVSRNHVNRHGQGTIEDGGLFHVEEDWRFCHEREDLRDLDLYVETAEPLERVSDLLAALGRRGYGRDAGIGRGRWQVAAAAEDVELAAHPGPRRMSLSRGVLDPTTMRDLLYRLEPHAGRLGPELSLAGTSPFKRSVLLLRPGATFTPEGPGPWGRMLTGLHPDRPEVVLNARHIAIPFAEAATAAEAA